MPIYSPTITVMLKAVRRASRALVRDFGELENLQVSKKSIMDFVSAADVKAEKNIIEDLRKARPKFGFLAREGSVIPGEDKNHRWIIAPLDGEINFLHGHYLFCSTIALEKTNPDGSREIIAAVNESPVLKESYWAEKGMGAWVEYDNSSSRRLRVSARKTVADALFCLGSLNSDMQTAHKLVPLAGGVRAIGSTALALAHTASGKFDGFLQHNTNYRDIAAGILFLREAGGIVSTYDNKNDFQGTASIIAANDVIHGNLFNIIHSHGRAPGST